MRTLILLFTVALTGCAYYAGTAEDVSFTSSDGVVLHGSLVFPRERKDSHPAVIMLHGAEQATRSFVYRKHANIFLERGFVVLLYDKRGAGASGGVHRATFDQLIEDAIAGIRLLESHPAIDPASIGIMSASESGWITPEIAARVGNLAFAVNKVGPAVSWQETVAWENYNELLQAGVSEDAARGEIELLKRVWTYQINRDPAYLQTLQHDLAVWQHRPDSLLPNAIDLPDDVRTRQLSYDPVPFLNNLRVPMLYIYGSDDVNIPTTRCVEQLRILRQAGSPVFFHVYEDAGHELGAVALTPPFYRFESGYEELIGAFALKHLGAGD